MGSGLIYTEAYRMLAEVVVLWLRAAVRPKGDPHPDSPIWEQLTNKRTLMDQPTTVSGRWKLAAFSEKGSLRTAVYPRTTKAKTRLSRTYIDS